MDRAGHVDHSLTRHVARLRSHYWAARGGSKTQVHTRALPAGSPNAVIDGEDEFRVYITLQHPPTPPGAVPCISI